MMTFLEFLNKRNKPINNYGIGTGHSPGSAFGVVNPAKPAKHVSVGFGLKQTYPKIKIGSQRSGVVLNK
jgi:hypothetical protein